jgi:aldehyde:ferredoxin oxidoreductase
MPNAYIGKILRVDLSKGVLSEEGIREDWIERFIGGAGLATKYHYSEVPRGVDPLREENHLVFMTGPLTGTVSASASRYSVVAKSPLTGIWGHGNSGGSFGPALKHSGYDGIILKGISPHPVYLRIVDGKSELCDARSLWGKTVPEPGFDPKRVESEMTIASIGPGASRMVCSVMNNSIAPWADAAWSSDGRGDEGYSLFEAINSQSG